MKNELTPELLKKAKAAPSSAALLALAEENGLNLTAEEAASYFARFHPGTGTLADEELENVTGGGCGKVSYGICLRKGGACTDCRDLWVCINCGHPFSLHTKSTVSAAAFLCPNEIGFIGGGTSISLHKYCKYQRN